MVAPNTSNNGIYLLAKPILAISCVLCWKESAPVSDCCINTKGRKLQLFCNPY